MLSQFRNLYERLGFKREGGRRVFEFNENILAKLGEQARDEKIPLDDLVAEIVTTGLEKRREVSALATRWDSLSRREKEVTALTCRGYTNRQIAARLGIGEDTVRTHVTNALRKFDMHGKLEMHTALKEWDFSEWDQ